MSMVPPVHSRPNTEEGFCGGHAEQSVVGVVFNPGATAAANQRQPIPCSGHAVHGNVSRQGVALQGSDPGVDADDLQVQILQPSLGCDGRKGGVSCGLSVVARVSFRLAVSVAGQL